MHEKGWRLEAKLVVFLNVDGNSKASLISISIVNMSLQTFMSRAATSIVSVDGRSVQRNLHPRGTNSSAFHTSLLFFIEARGEFLCYSPLLKLLTELFNSICRGRRGRKVCSIIIPYINQILLCIIYRGRKAAGAEEEIQRDYY